MGRLESRAPGGVPDVSTALLSTTESRQGSADDDLSHIYYCDPDRALCGADLADVPEIEDDDTDCIVCLDLEEQPCPDCED